MSYDSSKIEKKWQKAWKDADLYKCDAYDFSKPKYYVLDMFISKCSRFTRWSR